MADHFDFYRIFDRNYDSDHVKSWACVDNCSYIQFSIYYGQMNVPLLYFVDQIPMESILMIILMFYYLFLVMVDRYLCSLIFFYILYECFRVYVLISNDLISSFYLFYFYY